MKVSTAFYEIDESDAEYNGFRPHYSIRHSIGSRASVHNLNLQVDADILRIVEDRLAISIIKRLATLSVGNAPR